MNVHHQSMFVQERIDTLRREAEQQRLVNELRKARRAGTAAAREEEATGRVGGRTPRLRRVLRWGTGT
jgi:hypothetical protein